MCPPEISSASLEEALRAHADARAALIADERSLRVDAEKLKALTPEESVAEAAVRALRAEEHVTVWEKDSETPQLFVSGLSRALPPSPGADPCLSAFQPGMHFLTSRELIEGTKLFKIISRMPVSLLELPLHAVRSAQLTRLCCSS